MKKESLIPKTWNIPQVLRNRLGSEVGRQRAMVAEGHILLILHLPPKPNDDGREGRFIWRSPDGNWVSNDLGSGPDTVKRHLDQYEKLILEFDEMEEAAGNATQNFSVLEGLAPLQRAARHLHQVLQEARKELPEATEIINFRDHAYNIERKGDSPNYFYILFQLKEKYSGPEFGKTVLRRWPEVDPEIGATGLIRWG